VNTLCTLCEHEVYTLEMCAGPGFSVRFLCVCICDVYARASVAYLLLHVLLHMWARLQGLESGTDSQDSRPGKGKKVSLAWVFDITQSRRLCTDSERERERGREREGGRICWRKGVKRYLI